MSWLFDQWLVCRADGGTWRCQPYLEYYSEPKRPADPSGTVVRMINTVSWFPDPIQRWYLGRQLKSPVLLD